MAKSWKKCRDCNGTKKVTILQSFRKTGGASRKDVEKAGRFYRPPQEQREVVVTCETCRANPGKEYY